MKRKVLLPILLAILLTNCSKVDVMLDDNVQDDNPDIVYYDNYPIELASYKTDSFITSGQNVLMAGYHIDPAFGRVMASSYISISLPAYNPVQSQNVLFDSLVLFFKPNGNYYGDTSLPIRFVVNKLTEKIKNEDDANTEFSNSRTFAYEAISSGTRTITFRPTKDTVLTIRLADGIGSALLQKLKANASEIQTEENFLNYIKGFRLSADTTFSNAIYFFGLNADNAVMRLHYRLNSTFQEEKYLDFPLNTSHQFNHINYNSLNTALNVFTPNKKQLKQSTLTANKSYIHSNAGIYTKISFPNIFSLKELHPYIKIMKAELIVRPAPGTYSYPYQLPSTLNLYTTDENNNFIDVLTDASSGERLTGNLALDYLYGVNTQYSYDVTAYLTALLAAGRFSNSSLLLIPPDYYSSTSTSRLIINDQSLSNSIQLKLYVLGL